MNDYYDADDEFSRSPSSDLDAERYTLAAMMQSPLAVEQVVSVVGPHDFYRPGHGDIFISMISMYACEEPITPVTLRKWMERDYGGAPPSLRMQWPMYLADLFGLPTTAVEGIHHARIVWECSTRRRVEEIGHRLVQMSVSHGEDPAEMIADAQRQLDLLAAGSTAGDNRALTTDEFLALDTPWTAPVFDGLLHHQEKVVIVGIEGDGKTTLAHQAAYCLGAGLHPFKFRPVKPGKALIIDLENPQALLQPRLRGLQDLAAACPNWNPANVRLWAEPSGIDLTQASVAFRLADLIRQERPDLIVAGPVYQMFEEGERDNPKHAAICKFFNLMRGRYGCATWLEHHVPIAQSNGKRVMRPLGSGIWSRWPEFGISLERTGRKDGALKLGRFRNDRATGRDWPRFIRRSQSAGQWPWEAVYEGREAENLTAAGQDML
jgi:hypothetical protein